jgi:hypothetical protein
MFGVLATRASLGPAVWAFLVLRFWRWGKKDTALQVGALVKLKVSHCTAWNVCRL